MADKNLQAAAASPDEIKDDAQRPLLAVHLDNNNKTAPPLPPPPVAHHPWNWKWKVVCLWSFFNALLFPATAMVITMLVLHRLTPCSTETMQSSMYFVCVRLADEAAAEVRFLMSGELLCSAAVAAALAPLQHMPLNTSRRWRVLLWVALAATVGMHCMKVASDRIVLAATGHGSTFRVAFPYVCLAMDLVAGVLLSCSPHRL